MDVAEYRRKYEAELELAAREKVSFRDLLGSVRAGQPEALGTVADVDDLTAAVAVIRDSGADIQLKAAALQLISLDIDKNPELYGPLLELLGDGTASPDARMAVLNLMQQISFGAASFRAIRPDYLATLRSIIADPGVQLREQAISILAQQKDEYVQRRLIEGLEGHSTPLIPVAKALQCLGHDLHAEYFPLLRRIIQDPPSPAAKEEAIRLLAADPDAADLLISILQDRSESLEARKLSAIALQNAAPEQFAQQVRQIVLEDDEEELHVVFITALTYVPTPTEMVEDSELTTRIEQLRTESASPQIMQAATGFLSRQAG
jgi:HEAT repeat protein